MILSISSMNTMPDSSVRLTAAWLIFSGSISDSIFLLEQDRPWPGQPSGGVFA